jgi:hypothetical protein
MIHRERILAGRFLERPTLSPLVPLLWLLSLNLAGFGVMQGVFNAGVGFVVLGACTLLGSFMYGAALLGRRS